MFYTHSLITPNYLCDQYDNLSPWAVVRLFQEIACHHSETHSIGFSELIRQGRAWVVCRAYYRFDRLPHEAEPITLKTWSRGTDGLFAFRDSQILDGEGNAVVASSTYWAIMELGSRHVMRMHDFMDSFKYYDGYATDKQRLDRLRMPKDVGEPQQVAQFKVVPSMLDHTNHVNNAEYVRWIFDTLPQGSNIATPYHLCIEYLQETQPGEMVTIHSLPTAQGTYFSIANPRATAVIAILY
ncbi:MAG: hypothetical protein IJK84_07665 [Bacteroidales bacterium]|nr:hypothetical protein [Bacteroidales bacterium]